MFKKFSIALFAATLVVSCSTEVDLNADWQDKTIVYGVLDQNDEYHFIRINKAFLGDGNYFDFAMIRDSSEYKNMTAYVEEMFNGVLLNTYPLRDTELVNRDLDGIFYAPEHTAYYFKKNNLNENYTYRLKAIINEGTPAEKTVFGETGLIPGFSISSPLTIGVGTYDGATSTEDYNEETKGAKFSPPAADKSNLYEIVWRIKWDEYTATDTVRKHYNWLVGSVTRDAINSGQIEYLMSGEAFFTTIANACGNNPSVIRRVFRAVDVIVYAGSIDLETYIAVNKPSTGIVQERPEYTNITNGLGIFTSRIHETRPNVHMGSASTKLLIYGSHTNHLLFCVDSAAFSGLGLPECM